MSKILLQPTLKTASASFMFETALNENGFFKVHSQDVVSLILLKRWGAKEKMEGKKD